jgi:flagellar protein FliO/FliZ
MLWYILKLVVLLPLIAGMIWGSLKLSRKMQARLGAPQGGRSVRVVETMMLSPTIKLAVLEFHGREILVSASRTGLARLAEAPARGSNGDDDDDEGDFARPSPAAASRGVIPADPSGTTAIFSQTLRRFQ